MPRGRKNAKSVPKAEDYRHPETKALMRPEVGTQAQFHHKRG